MEENTVQMTNETENTSKKSIEPKWLILVAGVIVILVAFFALSGPEKVELKDYLNANPGISGFSGQATIEISDLFDETAFAAMLLEDVADTNLEELQDMTMEELSALFAQKAEIYEKYDEALGDIEIKILKNGKEVTDLTGLTNGDVIKVEASSKTPKNEFFDKKFKSGSIQIKIKGLTEGKSIDVFDETDFSITYRGVSGDGNAILKWDETVADELGVKFGIMNHSYSYSNGDKVEVYVSYNKDEWNAEGCFPKEETKEYTVAGLDTYVEKIEDISQESMDEMKTNVENALHEEESTWVNSVSIENITFLGNYLLNKKDSSSYYGGENQLYFVYRVDVFEDFAPNGGDSAHITFYYYGMYEGIAADKDGNVDLEYERLSSCSNWYSRRIKISSSAWFGESTITYNGYETLEELFDDCVTDYADDYTYETTVK